jgi:hypothetical protein
MATNEEWAVGYARQAGADFATYQLLQRESRSQIPQCHKLHFLQMACEKLVKAHLIKGGADPKSLQSSHAYVEGTLPVVIRHQLILLGNPTHDSAGIMKHAHQISKEIDMLALRPSGTSGAIRARTTASTRGKTVQRFFASLSIGNSSHRICCSPRRPEHS